MFCVSVTRIVPGETVPIQRGDRNGRSSLSAGRRTVAVVLVMISCLLSSWAGSVHAQETCFERLDNGVDLTGWVRSTTNHHGPGEGWTVEDGALTGRQTAGQRGGILMTDKAYKDVEVIFEVQIDWGCDSGLFFRTTDGDRAYQVNIDNLEGGSVGTIYGESFASELIARDYTLTDQGRTAVAEGCRPPLLDLSKWSTMWDPAGFNELRARIEGNPARIQTWVSGVKVTDFTDDRARSELEASGPLALQVHMGPRWATGGAVRFRNVRARDLSVPCDAPDTNADAAAPSVDVATGECRPRASGCSCEAPASQPRSSAAALSVLATLWALSRFRQRRR